MESDNITETNPVAQPETQPEVEAEEAEIDLDVEGQNKHAVLNEAEGEDETKLEVDMGEDKPADFGEFVEYLKSNKTWDDLNIPKELKQNLIAKGFKKPSKIQTSVIALFQKKIDRDVIAQSQNGSGKTLAF